MTHADPVRCVCFDWGGVILGHHRSWSEACAAAGLELRSGHDDPALLSQRRMLNHQYSTGALACEEFFSALSRAWKGAYSVSEVRAVHHAWLTREYDGLAEIIDRLNARVDLTTALLSNTCPAHYERHRPRAGGSTDFPTIGLLKTHVASHIARCAKPEEAIYRALESATGCLASEVLFFDDVAENIHAARERGWRAELIDHTRQTAPQVEQWLSAHGVE